MDLVCSQQTSSQSIQHASSSLHIIGIGCHLLLLFVSVSRSICMIWQSAGINNRLWETFFSKQFRPRESTKQLKVVCACLFGFACCLRVRGMRCDCCLAPWCDTSIWLHPHCISWYNHVILTRAQTALKWCVFCARDDSRWWSNSIS